MLFNITAPALAMWAAAHAFFLLAGVGPLVDRAGTLTWLIGPLTVFAGLYRRATGQPPFQLAPRWIEKRDQLDPNTVFNISSDNDIVGGNSGSPLLNAKAEVIGAIFDGNIHSLGGTYFFDPKLNRAVTVSTAAMTEALNKVYGQQRLVAELTSP